MRRAVGVSRKTKPLRPRAKRLRKPLPRSLPAREFARRAFVRLRWAPNKHADAWAAHGRYLEREGAQEEGKRGIGFDALSDAVNLSQTVYAWQHDGDPKLYKLVLSPEDGIKLDLVQYTRSFMREVEKHAGRSLEWTAIDHHNTDNPHVHVLLRGNIELARDLVREGMRSIAEDQATRMLGYKSEREKRAEMDRDIAARRFTQLDRLIKAKTELRQDGDFIVTESGLSRIGSDVRYRQSNVEMRNKRIARLQKLEELGVAEKVGSQTWRLDGNWESALKQLEVLRTRSTMLLQHRELMTDPRCLPVVTKLKAGESLIGRSLGGGLDESTDRPYLLVEGMDGRAHFIARREGDAPVRPGQLVAIEAYEGKSGRPGLNVREYDLVIPARGFAGAMANNGEVARAAREEVDRRSKAGVAQVQEAMATAGFAALMQRAILEQARRQARDLEKKAGKRRHKGDPRKDPDVER
ncbi:MAG: DUF3363 domain-containing protein [Betaproteobacteria bacterium]|nr:DUF3363 domain-containing protein [Betaproteobacteria bacterium]